ncbi:peroxidase family protein [Blastopirellula retiformator]|uniref:Peroxidase n=1 Tax=Blastopirellula retiformator TaxID=2527970 RepID=A0A5C5V0T5_9BACT|nr:peroxidase family protein [Blastopirellula retiformator]TWT32058.1 peroxidase [Blastopirellula retiformator]
MRSKLSSGTRPSNLEALEQRELFAIDTLSIAPIDDATLPPPAPVPTALIDEVRSIDGAGNNVENPEYGSVGENFVRVAAADYGDGISSLAGEDRPSAREISNALAAQDPDSVGNERQLSAFIYVWGQFLDHDIDLTEGGDAEAVGIAVPTGDPYFDPDASGDDVISFFRSLFDPATGDSVDNPREQFNSITAFIDGSQVYGSTQEVADSLRSFEGGKLLTSDGDLLPIDDQGFFAAGDIRANENIELTALQTLFVREHNFWAERIGAENPALSDEEIYQQARSIVIAEIQSITFNEFLPALLGEGVLPDYAGYDSTINPQISNEFATAGYRMGHSLLNDDIEFFGNDGRAVADEVTLAEAFFNPALVQQHGIDSLLKYAASSQSQEVDTQIVDSVRNFLFGPPGSGGLDLASLNIQRGRDHGIADYNSVREAYGLPRVTSFAEITSDPELQQSLEELYGTVDNIDLWVGALAEDHVPGGSVGETTQAILVEQFTRLRDGDRFWYENIFSAQDVDRIERTSLSDIIQRNTVIDNLQENVFFMSATVSGTVLADGQQDGRRDRPRGLPGATVQLLDDEGEVIAEATTDRRGNYHFDNFLETGDYQIQALLLTPTGPVTQTQDVLISVGGEAIRNVDFGPQTPPRPGDNDRPRDRRDQPRRDDRRQPPRERLFADETLLDPMGELIDDLASDLSDQNRPRAGR